jgi:alkylation response protein AidB-like acyl-CoA dehydrogenase
MNLRRPNVARGPRSGKMFSRGHYTRIEYGVMSTFFQDAPTLGNQYEEDPLLRAWLRRRMPDEMRAQVEPDLRRLGARVVSDILALGEAAERDVPRHVPYDAWGRRVDVIETSAAWKALDRVSAEEGLVAVGYERTRGAWSRVEQMARLYLFHASSATYSCPLAMTDGAARLIEVHGGESAPLRATFGHLTSRDPRQFWTSGQWMTERTGGSDVSLTSTIARHVEGGAPDEFALYGDKWFTSATTSQIAMTLARIPGSDPGSKGLSVFCIELRDPGSGELRGIRVNRLKDKLGTRALPTAELTLDGTPARLVGGESDGVKKIASMFNVTRVYNAVCAVSGMRRAIALATDYARKRVAFGKRLIEQPLHRATLDEMALEWAGCFALTFYVAELLGREECGVASERDSAILRLLIPVAKLYTAKQAVAVASEALEAFGGAGYIEDTGLPRLLRDAQVLSIWEGTTNVLALDALRAIERTGSLGAWAAEMRTRCADERVLASLARVDAHAERAAREGSEYAQTHARSLAYAIARTSAAVLLMEHDTDLAGRWISRGLPMSS